MHIRIVSNAFLRLGEDELSLGCARSCAHSDEASSSPASVLIVHVSCMRADTTLVFCVTLLCLICLVCCHRTGPHSSATSSRPRAPPCSAHTHRHSLLHGDTHTPHEAEECQGRKGRRRRRSCRCRGRCGGQRRRSGSIDGCCGDVGGRGGYTGHACAATGEACGYACGTRNTCKCCLPALLVTTYVHETRHNGGKG